jgi:hypothetical protein
MDNEYLFDIKIILSYYDLATIIWLYIKINMVYL